MVEEQPEILQEEVAEAIEHRDVLLALRGIISTEAGRVVFKYLFKHFDVAQLPELGLDGQLLHEKLGFLRAGNSIFKLVSEADFKLAATLLAQVEKDRYDKIYADAKIGQS